MAAAGRFTPTPCPGATATHRSSAHERGLSSCQPSCNEPSVSLPWGVQHNTCNSGSPPLQPGSRSDAWRLRKASELDVVGDLAPAGRRDQLGAGAASSAAVAPESAGWAPECKYRAPVWSARQPARSSGRHTTPRYFTLRATWAYGGDGARFGSLTAMSSPPRSCRTASHRASRCWPAAAPPQPWTRRAGVRSQQRCSRPVRRW